MKMKFKEYRKWHTKYYLYSLIKREIKIALNKNTYSTFYIHCANIKTLYFMMMELRRL